MNDFHTLQDAFDEYERRADAAPPAPVRGTAPARRSTRPLLVAASVVAVVGVATGAVLLGHHDSTPSRNGQPGAPVSSTAASDPTSSAPSSAATSSPISTTSAAPTPTTTPTSPPQKASFEDRFRHALDGSATFTVTLRQTDFLAGVLTTAGNVSGGYDIQSYRGNRGERPMCPDTDKAACTIHSLPNGGAVGYIHDPLLGAPGSVTNTVDYVRADGMHFLMSVSNQRDPKGLSPKLAAQPPLTVDQIIDILTSDQW
jgi:hypothetical protein